MSVHRLNPWGRSLHCRFGLLALGGAALYLGGPPTASNASAPGEEGEEEPVVRIEEDWMLVLNEPDDTVDSPQFHTVMSPFGHTDSFFAQVLWNYRETPEFTSGGVQLHSYEGEHNIRLRSVEYRQLSNTAESITWTQALSTDGVILSFEVLNGLSTSWGSFGRDMRIDETANLADLWGYYTGTSVDNACVTYGSNRVDLLMITQVRYYGPSGLLSVDSVPRVVFEYGADE